MNDAAATPEYEGECAFGWSLGRQAPGKENLQTTEVLPNRAAKADAAWAAR